MRLAETVTFGGCAVDRAGEIRHDARAVEALACAATSRHLPVWRGKPLLAAATGLETPAWQRPIAPVLRGATTRVLLGRAGGVAWFGHDISAWTPDALPDTLGAFADPSEQRHPDVGDDARFVEVRGAMMNLGPRDAELVATARAVLGWHATHGFCARCGAATDVVDAGWRRACPSCNASHFPRTDPVAIMLVTHGNAALLGRSPGWPDGMFSLLAGFVEPGETVESAVRRETFEETGVRVGPVSYLASQPWPFPASLMLGCHGAALGRDIVLDPTEIEDALWVTREDMVEVMAGRHARVAPARRGAIAHFLLHHWLADTLD